MRELSFSKSRTKSGPASQRSAGAKQTIHPHQFQPASACHSRRHFHRTQGLNRTHQPNSLSGGVLKSKGYSSMHASPGRCQGKSASLPLFASSFLRSGSTVSDIAISFQEGNGLLQSTLSAAGATRRDSRVDGSSRNRDGLGPNRLIRQCNRQRRN